MTICHNIYSRHPTVIRGYQVRKLYLARLIWVHDSQVSYFNACPLLMPCCVVLYVCCCAPKKFGWFPKVVMKSLAHSEEENVNFETHNFSPKNVKKRGHLLSVCVAWNCAQCRYKIRFHGSIKLFTKSTDNLYSFSVTSMLLRNLLLYNVPPEL